MMIHPSQNKLLMLIENAMQLMAADAWDIEGDNSSKTQVKETAPLPQIIPPIYNSHYSFNADLEAKLQLCRTLASLKNSPIHAKPEDIQENLELPEESCGELKEPCDASAIPAIGMVLPDPSLINKLYKEQYIQNGGHRPLPKCKVEGCCSNVESSSAQYCAAHRSTRRCQKEGCNKCAQGATKFCIAHGGGRRCTFPGCFKGARDKFFCAAHGGGKRCTQEGCSKSAVGGSNLCTAHGGGKRCQYPGCTKSSQSNTMYCVRHGGGRSCMFQGCTKVARGKTDFCAAHGGGVRCRITNCNKLAVGSQQLCRTHSHALHGNSTMSGNGKGVRKVSVGDDDDLDTASMSSQSRPSDDFSEVNTAKRARVL
eukprot:scaffold5893_cov178-Ochromonas_danica.AAC.5